MNLQQPSGRIIASLELQISHVQKSGTNYSEIEDNVVVKALILNLSITYGLTLVKTHSNDTDTYNGENEKRLDDTETSIYLPPKVIEEAKKDKRNNGAIPISFVIYKNASLFGTDTGMNLMEEIAKMSSHIISSEVISVNVDGGPMENLTPPVILRFFLPEKDKVCDQPLCVYYVPNGTNNGTWSTDGCSTSTEENLTICKCDHLSSFTVLMGIASEAISTDPPQPLYQLDSLLRDISSSRLGNSRPQSLQMDIIRHTIFLLSGSKLDDGRSSQYVFPVCEI
ncbi:putative G-protein coupled receptor [Apostichopus japonicus]|uniref:Putative G-protein coupled receptor n=1 Tax=Stichopus japonicus TaxID=307972 RepID=A0A2G8K2M9_STIJA|nr:putative G-protein coupled receptor [Apostichopus japonicus]